MSKLIGQQSHRQTLKGSLAGVQGFDPDFRFKVYTDGLPSQLLTIQIKHGAFCKLFFRYLLNSQHKRQSSLSFYLPRCAQMVSYSPFSALATGCVVCHSAAGQLMPTVMPACAYVSSWSWAIPSPCPPVPADCRCQTGKQPVQPTNKSQQIGAAVSFGFNFCRIFEQGHFSILIYNLAWGSEVCLMWVRE